MNQPAKKSSMRDRMPETAAFVDKKRAEWGADHVDYCLRQAKAGAPGFFYAVERGHVTGTPFPPGHQIEQWQAQAILWGVASAVFMAHPDEVQRGAH